MAPCTMSLYRVSGGIQSCSTWRRATNRNALNELIKSYPWLGVSILPGPTRLLSTSVMALKKKIKAYCNSSLFWCVYGGGLHNMFTSNVTPIWAFSLPKSSEQPASFNWAAWMFNESKQAGKTETTANNIQNQISLYSCCQTIINGPIKVRHGQWIKMELNFMEMWTHSRVDVTKRWIAD